MINVGDVVENGTVVKITIVTQEGVKPMNTLPKEPVPNCVYMNDMNGKPLPNHTFDYKQLKLIPITVKQKQVKEEIKIIKEVEQIPVNVNIKDIFVTLCKLAPTNANIRNFINEMKNPEFAAKVSNEFKRLGYNAKKRRTHAN